MTVSWRDSKYLDFSWLGKSATGRTHRWTVDAKRSGDILGVVEWYGPWRQYVFQPDPNTEYNKGCLLDIADFLDEMNAEQRNRTER